MCKSHCFFIHSLIGSFIYLSVLGISREIERIGDGIIDRYIDRQIDIETGGGGGEIFYKNWLMGL